MTDTDKMTGKKIRCPQGYEAFLPDPLPPDIERPILFLTVKKVAKELKIAFTTAQRAVEKLEKMSIVKEVARAKRDRTYCAKVILDILDEPTKV